MSRLAFLILGILATSGLIFNMAATPLHQDAILFKQNTLSPVEVIILVGFLLVTLFDISSILWVLFRVGRQKGTTPLDSITLAWGILCILLLLGEKAMIDEIARESRLGLETLGEWIALYVGLTIQLFYNVFLLFRIAQADRSLIQATANTDPSTAAQ
jgi:hypothetical protein